MDDDGTVDEEALLAIAPEDMQPILAPVFKKCGTQGNDLLHSIFYIKENQVV